jgi:hypothetical protein
VCAGVLLFETGGRMGWDGRVGTGPRWVGWVVWSERGRESVRTPKMPCIGANGDVFDR